MPGCPVLVDSEVGSEVAFEVEVGSVEGLVVAGASAAGSVVGSRVVAVVVPAVPVRAVLSTKIFMQTILDPISREPPPQPQVQGSLLGLHLVVVGLLLQVLMPSRASR